VSLRIIFDMHVQRGTCIRCHSDKFSYYDNVMLLVSRGGRQLDGGCRIRFGDWVPTFNDSLQYETSKVTTCGQREFPCYSCKNIEQRELVPTPTTLRHFDFAIMQSSLC
jgi:hypothetical protein